MGSLIVSIVAKLLPNGCFRKIGFLNMPSKEYLSSTSHLGEREHRRKGTERVSLVKVGSNS